MKKLIFLICMIFALTSIASADVIVLTFEGLQNGESVDGFYNGGTGSYGSGPGPNYGVTFRDNALALIDADAGGSGNFGGEPSPDTILYFLSDNAAVMNVLAGFDTGFSFFYTAVNNPGFVTVWDDFDGTGNILATLDLPLTPNNGAPDPSGTFSPLVAIGVGFTGIAKSVSFGGVGNQIGFDNITFGSETPGTVPDGGMTLSLLGGALIGLETLRRRFRN